MWQYKVEVLNCNQFTRNPVECQSRSRRSETLWQGTSCAELLPDMKAQRKKTNLACKQCYEFSHPNPRNSLKVEVTRTGVVVYAACNNFSHEQKIRFLRYLVDEGFIPDQPSFLPGRGSHSSSGLWWVTGTGRKFTDFNYSRRGRSMDGFIERLLSARWLLWVVEMSARALNSLFRTHPNEPRPWTAGRAARTDS